MKYSLMLCVEITADDLDHANCVLEEIVETITDQINVNQVYSTDVSEFKFDA